MRALSSGLRSGDGTEPDVVLLVGDRLIVIEAKYGSGFGERQLHREWAGAVKMAAARGLARVLMLTVTKGLHGEPPEVTSLRKDLDLGRAIAHMSWQQIGLVLDDLTFPSPEATELRNDVLSMMEKRGVRHVYTGIEEEDWWLVSAAQIVARKRVYPQIAALARELQETLVPDGLRWGVSEDKVVHYHSFSLNAPASWARSYLQLPLWPTDFATQGRGKSWWATFHVLFDFLNAEVSIGYLTRPQNVTDSKHAWIPVAGKLLSSIQDLPDEWVLSSSHGNYAEVKISRHPRHWMQAELEAELAVPFCELVIERRLTLHEFTGGQQARELILEAVAIVRQRADLLPAPARKADSAVHTSEGEVADDGALSTAETEAAEASAERSLDA